MKDLSNENVIHVKKDRIEYLQFKKLLEYSDIINLVFGLWSDNININETDNLII